MILVDAPACVQEFPAAELQEGTSCKKSTSAMEITSAQFQVDGVYWTKEPVRPPLVSTTALPSCVSHPERKPSSAAMVRTSL